MQNLGAALRQMFLESHFKTTMGKNNNSRINWLLQRSKIQSRPFLYSANSNKERDRVGGKNKLQHAAVTAI